MVKQLTSMKDPNSGDVEGKTASSREGEQWRENSFVELRSSELMTTRLLPSGLKSSGRKIKILPTVFREGINYYLYKLSKF